MRYAINGFDQAPEWTQLSPDEQALVRRIQDGAAVQRGWSAKAVRLGALCGSVSIDVTADSAVRIPSFRDVLAALVEAGGSPPAVHVFQGIRIIDLGD